MIAWPGDWSGWATTSVLMALVHLPHRLFILDLALVEAVWDTLLLIPVSLLTWLCYAAYRECSCTRDTSSVCQLGKHDRMRKAR